MPQRITGLEVILLPAVTAFAMGCSGNPQPGTGPRPEEAWVATTCSPAAPDTTGWKVYRFADIDISVPPQFKVGNLTTRTIAFGYRGSALSLEVSPVPTRSIFYAAGRPALVKEEAGCPSHIGGYSGVVMATARANSFTVTAEWDGAPLWGESDWRKRLVAQIHTRFLQDAQLLRDALHTIRAARDTVR